MYILGVVIITFTSIPMNQRQLLLLLALFLIAPQASCQNEPTEMKDRLSQLLSTYEDWGFSGTVLVARGSEVLFEEGYGFANRKSGERNTAETRYDFASVAKTFTGALVLRLEADGVFSVNDKLEKYMDAFPDARKSPVTLHHLATHTGGLAHRSQSQLVYGPDRGAFIESMRNAPFESPPGESYRYSNAGSSLLAAMAEKISGISHEAYVRTHFFEPLGLNTARFIPETEYGEPGLALGYVDDSNTHAPSIYRGEWGWGFTGATGITASVQDIYTWFNAVYYGDVLPPDQYKKAFDESEEEAYGWHTDRDEEGRLRVHKGGGLPAMQAQILAYPEDDIVIVWAHNNMARNWRRALNNGITAVALGESFGPIPELDLDYRPGERKPPKPGVYANAKGLLVEIREDNGMPVLGRNSLDITQGPLSAGQNKDWVLFSIEDVSWIRVYEDTDNTLILSGPNGLKTELRHTNRPN